MFATHTRAPKLLHRSGHDSTSAPAHAFLAAHTPNIAIRFRIPFLDGRAKVPLLAIALLVWGGCGAYTSSTVNSGLDPVGAGPTGSGIDAVGEPLAVVESLTDDSVCEPVGDATSRQNLGACVNSNHVEALPRLSPDGTRLYFLRSGSPRNVGGAEGGEDIWYAERAESGGWTVARNPGPPLNTEGNDFVVAVLDDGKRLLVGNAYLPDGDRAPGFSVVHRTAAGWSAPEALEVEDWYSHSRWVSASLSADGEVLVFHAERDDGRGGADLYVSFLGADGTWSAPINLGDDVNTEGDEITPFLAADGETLYFSSDGRGGFGDQDVFVTRRLDESWQRWSEPENLGPRINTSGFDAYFIAPEGDDFAYLASSEGARAGTDLFRVRLREPEPVIVAADPPEPEEPRPVERIVLRNVHFDFDRADLRPESVDELERVVRWLLDNPEIRIEVQGHTDSTGPDLVNGPLSTRRAEAVRAYLIEHGVEGARIEARGFGSRVPTATNETVAGRQLNRRVELRILDEDGDA